MDKIKFGIFVALIVLFFMALGDSHFLSIADKQSGYHQ